MVRDDTSRVRTAATGTPPHAGPARASREVHLPGRQKVTWASHGGGKPVRSDAVATRRPRVFVLRSFRREELMRSALLSGLVSVILCFAAVATAQTPQVSLILDAPAEVTGE